MGRNTRSECLRELPGEAWEVDSEGRLSVRWRRGNTEMVLRPTLERRRRREAPPVWTCEAVEWCGADDDPEGPLRVAFGWGASCAEAMEDAAAQLVASCLGGAKP